MAVTNYKAPTAASGTNRTNPTNVYASDDSRATYANSAQNNLYATGFDFSGIPSGSTIVGVEVIVEGNGASSTASNRSIKVGMTKDGSSLSGSFLANQNLPRNTDGSLIFGSPTNLFSTTISYSELQASTWGIVIAVGNTNTSERRIDQIIARVYYTNTTAAPASLVQSKTGNSGTYVLSHNFSFDSSVATGNLIVIGVVSGGYEIAGITDSASNTYTRIQYGNTANLRGALRYAYNVTGGSLTITLDVDGASNYDDICYVAYEFEGVPTTDPLDVSAENVEGGYDSAHPTGTTGTTNQADEIVVAMYGGDSNTTYHILEDDDFGEFIDTNGSDLYQSIVMTAKEVSSTGTQSATFVSVAFVRGYGAIATFKLSSSAQNIEQTLTETVVVTESLSESITESLSDTVVASESVLESVGETLTDTVTTTDSLSESVVNVLSETVTVSEQVSQQQELHQTLSDTVVTTESVLESIQEEFSETVSVDDNVASGFNQTLSDTVSVSDSVSESIVDVIVETVNVSEDVAQQQELHQTLTDTVSTTDTIVESVQETLEESVSVTESLQESIQETLQDTITVSETMIEAVSETLSDQVTVTDSLDDVVSDTETYTETVTVSDAITQHIEQVLTETVIVSDDIIDIVADIETYTETVTTSDSITQHIQQTLTENVTVSESMTQTESNNEQQEITETVVVSDTIYQNITQTLVENVSVTDDVDAARLLVGLSVLVALDVYSATITQDEYTMTVTPDSYTSTISVDTYTCDVEVDTYAVIISM